MILYIYVCVYDFFLHSDALFGAAPFKFKKKCKPNIAFGANSVVSLKLHCFGLQPVSCSLSHSTTYHNLCFSSLDLFVLWPWSILYFVKSKNIATYLLFEVKNMANSDWIYTTKDPIFREVNNAISYQPGILKIQRETKMRQYIYQF